jgi:hypothetical protein
MPEHGLGRCDGHHKKIDCFEPPREMPSPGLARLLVRYSAEGRLTAPPA